MNTDSTYQDATDAVSTVPTSATEAVSDIVNEYPLAAVLTSAAIGAGLIALISMAARDDRPHPSNVLRTAPRSTRESAGDAFDELRAQISDLGRKLTASLPTPTEARRTSADLGEKASEAWSTVRDQAHAAIDQVAPKITAAAELARANPLWVSVVMGAVGALLGSQMLGRGHHGTDETAAKMSSAG
jgi:ElaB/YqjD/DUF883 family membrane-anchored ribosome-binding protein